MNHHPLSLRFDDLTVQHGPRLLSGTADGPGLEAHRARWGALGTPDLSALIELTREVDVRGRGGAGFPFATKLETTAKSSGRPIVVVNLSEGEPASAKDRALVLTSPHLVLDGAAVTARALGARSVHLVLPGEHQDVRAAVARAVEERQGLDGLRWRTHTADSRFVAGQARAVLELMAGRDNKPVTAWQPEPMRGHLGRPTLLSNAETHAQVGVLVALGVGEYAALGTDTEPGTCLLTLGGDSASPRVVEAAYGRPWAHLLNHRELARPVLLGGYHGTWAAPGALTDETVSREGLADRGLTLGAGVVLPLEEDDCPVHRTARLTEYLAGQSAQRCGPCLNGLPALAEAFWRVHEGTAGTEEVEHLMGRVVRRGACAHPDGTARLVASALTGYLPEVDSHRAGVCTYRTRAEARDDVEDTVPLQVVAR